MNVNIGEFVRIRRGTYKGDLALVTQFDSDLCKARLKLIPRLAEIEKDK